MTMVAHPTAPELSPATTNPFVALVSAVTAKLRRLNDMRFIRRSRRLRFKQAPETTGQEHETSLHSSDTRPVDREQLVSWDAFKSKRHVPAFMVLGSAYKNTRRGSRGKDRGQRPVTSSTTPSPHSLLIPHEVGEPVLSSSSHSSADDLQPRTLHDSPEANPLGAKTDKNQDPEGRPSPLGPDNTDQSPACYFCGGTLGPVRSSASNERAAYLYCGHVFGHKCLKKYIKNQFAGELRRSQTCPICPTPLCHGCGHVTIPRLEAPSDSERRHPGYFELCEYCGARETLKAIINGQELGALQMRTPQLVGFLPPEPSSATNIGLTGCWTLTIKGNDVASHQR
ncbi:hypothetical protein L249_5762 [Ophiocordyceps polyrhachis-furcata BCC 54312]|uniref:RING-type domain-containing protein n=1 Tax=Ophiocordyceps polyrhachis-furcata BCC 54312 TaxID=1330021 RepID=A0A367KZX4_9HYPO|nr:hypothetical protein L249_5762 [Ophiocordyceps polyrhachis-furcata BCC 54312]